MPVFYDGQQDYIDKLNEMYAFFEAGPFNSLPLTGGNLTGNLGFSGTGRRILADFSNATHSNRTLFQTNVANSNTVVGAAPAGAGGAGQFNAYASSDVNNSSTTQLQATPVRSALVAGNTGTASYLPLCFDTNAVERMRLATNGNFSFGTVMGGSPVGARTDGLVMNYGTKALQLRASSACEFGLSGTSGSHMQFYTDNGTNFVGAGSITSSGANTNYTTTSDYRLKNNPQILTGCTERICRLKPKKWTWPDGSDGDGFLAHEAAEVIPQSVVGVKDAMKWVTRYDAEGNPVELWEPAYQGMDKTYMIGNIVGMLQEQKALLDSALERIAQLENPSV